MRPLSPAAVATLRISGGSAFLLGRTAQYHCLCPHVTYAPRGGRQLWSEDSGPASSSPDAASLSSPVALRLGKAGSADFQTDRGLWGGQGVPLVSLRCKIIKDLCQGMTELRAQAAITVAGKLRPRSGPWLVKPITSGSKAIEDTCKGYCTCELCGADPGDALTNERKPKLRRAFFTKKSVLLNSGEELRHKCVSKGCFPELEGCTKIHITKTDFHQASVMKREVAEMCCVLRFRNCATKCFNIDGHF
ncbi:uncharacterized protein LOC144819903 [Lissotriton helveticus]